MGPMDMFVRAFSHLALKPDLTGKSQEPASLLAKPAHMGLGQKPDALSSGFLQHFEGPTNDRVFPDDSLLCISTAVAAFVLGVTYHPCSVEPLTPTATASMSSARPG
jgi:hypothetical protein